MTHYRVANVEPQLAFNWMANRGDGLQLTPDFAALAALDSEGVIRGIIAHSHSTPSSVHLHLVLESPIAWRVLRRVALPVLFEVLDKKFVLAQFRSSNERVRKLVEHYGFRQVVAISGGYQDGAEDLLVYRLDRVAWRDDG